jgi:nitrous oxidase accessory protein NosD
LAKADPGDTLLITGTCRERVVITTDGVTLDGQGTAVIDGGGPNGNDFTAALLIDGARGVIVRGLTIRNSSTGILAQSGATFKSQKCTIQDNIPAGVVVLDGSIAEIADSVLTHNHDGILGVSSLVVFKGVMKANNNQNFGVGAENGSTLEVRDGSLEASGNGGNGFNLTTSSLNSGINCEPGCQNHSQ